MGFLMSEFLHGLDHPFSISIGPGRLDLGKALFDPLFPTKGHEGMVLRVYSVFLPVVAVELLYRIGAFLQDLLQESLGRILGLVREDCGVQLPGEVVDGHKQVLSSPEGGFSRKQRQALRVHVKHLPGIILVVPFGPGL